MRNLSSRNWDQTQSKFSDFKRFALSPRLIRMRWMPVVDRLLIPMEDTVLNVKIQFVQIVRGFFVKIGIIPFVISSFQRLQGENFGRPSICVTWAYLIIVILRPRNFTLKSA